MSQSISRARQLLDMATSSDGAMVQIGARLQNEQVAYMQTVMEFLCKDGALATIEAETGIGKSLGYLLPACIYMSVNPDAQSILISTHTRALQRQILLKDWILVKKILTALQINLPTVTYRMGREAFFSLTRVYATIEKLMILADTDEKKKILDNFERAVIVSCTSGTGLWQDYLDVYEKFPAGIKYKDICMVASGEIDNVAYELHLENAKNAQVVVTNHASILSPHTFVNQHFHALIVDEAQEMPSVCESMSTQRLNVKNIKNSLIDTGLGGKGLLNTICLVDNLEKELKMIDDSFKKSTNVLSDTAHLDKLNSVVPLVEETRRACFNIIRKYEKKLDKSTLTQIDAAILKQFEEYNDTLASFVQNDNQYRRRAITFSDKYRYPSIASLATHAGSLFRMRSKILTNNVMLTSATLASIGKAEPIFRQICYSLGLDPMTIDFSRQFAPTDYGKLKFVLMKGDVPYPLRDFNEDGAVFNEKWLTHASLMIADAARMGATLVLTRSFDETQQFARVYPNAIIHQRGQKLGEIMDQFVQKGNVPGNILITPSAWHGVSFRTKDDKQLLLNLVITRIPFTPMSPDFKHLAIDDMVAKGKTVTMAKKILSSRELQQAVISLKQGIGRAIRNPDDDATVWLADPRVMAQGTTGNSVLNSAIPRRFSLKDALIYDGTLPRGERLIKPRRNINF